jgi:hypothetical protein
VKPLFPHHLVSLKIYIYISIDAIDKKIGKEIKNKTRLKKYKLNKKCRS